MKNKLTVWQPMSTAPKDDDIIIGLKSNFGYGFVGLDIVSFKPNRHTPSLDQWYSDMTNISYFVNQPEHLECDDGQSIIGWTPLPVLSSKLQ